MINGASLAEGLKDRLLSYMASALPIGNHESQRFLGDAFYQEWQRGVFKGPYFETIPPYERQQSLADRFEKRTLNDEDRLFAETFKPRVSWPDVDHKFPLAKTLRDRIWIPGSTEADLEESTTTHQALWARKLFKHQWEAFDRAVYRRENVIVATGTGSGKTECFLLPILYRLLTEPTSQRPQNGIRALLVYPLNALVEDQVMRLRRLLFWVNLQFHEPGTRFRATHQITFGRYTGDTPLNSTDFKRKEAEESLSGLGELVYRDEMQSRPPDILITNFTMLEYMLLREDDRQLFANPHLFSFIVLDELHTYAGTQGMEVSMLLRRLRGFLETKANKSCVAQSIGTSATLGGSDTKSEAAKFATTLFGSKFESKDVVLGTYQSRTTAAWDSSRWAKFLNLLAELDCDELFLESTDSEVGGKYWKSLVYALSVDELAFSPELPFTENLGMLFSRSGIADQVRTIIENQPDACLELDLLADVILGHVHEPRTVAGKLLGLLASATLNAEPLLALRTHFFVNEARGGQLCLYPKCESAPGGTDAWWKRLYISHHISCDLCNSRVFPLLLCRRCGFVYLEAWRYQSSLCPERDAGEKPEAYERWLFRPVNSDLPDLAKGHWKGLHIMSCLRPVFRRAFRQEFCPHTRKS
jgi:hypothetical protein